MVSPPTNDWYPYKKGRRDADTVRMHGKREAETEQRIYKVRKAKVCRQYQQLRQRHGADSSSKPLGNTALLTP